MQISNLEYVKSALRTDGTTLALYDGKRLITSSKRGVAPLIELLDSKEDISSFSAADKVIGRGAAFLYVLLGIKEIHTDVISKSALELLTRYGTFVAYEHLVPHIINRAGDGICPIESAVMPVTEPSEALIIIKEKLKNLSK